jgi:6-phosphogluconolactonase
MASDWLSAQHRGVTAVAFGMDDDGHIASLLPRAGGLDHALTTEAGYAVIDASACDDGGRWPTRITLTAAGFARAQHRFLLLRGASRRRVFELALAGDDVREMPIRSVLHTGAAPLHVHWYP